MLLFITLLNLVNSAILAQYRFGLSFGQVLKDYTSNARHCINGDSWTTTTNDAVLTDRGAYFSGGSEQLTFPPNDKVASSFNIPSTYSIAIWLNPDCTSCSIISRTKDSNSYFYYAFKTTNSLVAYYRFSNINTGQKFSGNNVYTLRKWMLITIGHSIFTCTISVDGTIEISINTGITTYGESGTFEMHLGKASYGFSTFSGFIWSFRLDDSLNIQTTYYVGSSSACLTGGCSVPCSPAVKDSYTGNGCISEQYNTALSASGTACPSGCPSGPCDDTACLNCDCIFGSCIMSVGQSVCDCPSGTTATPTTCLCSGSNYYNGNGCVVCESSCLTCDQSNICLTCIASNAGIDTQGCKCNDGYWGTKPLTSINSCSSCLVDCITCDSSTTCLTCISLHSTPSAGGCSCDSGYWGVSPLTSSSSCQACHSDCFTCSQSLLCLTCQDSNASPHASIGCICNSKFFNITGLNSDGNCLPCHSHCQTCINSLVCTTCIASNADPLPTQGCVCKDGFYSTGDLSSPTDCVSCHSHCSLCSSSLICIQCKALNSHPDTTGCTCDSSYYASSDLSNTLACAKCHLSCSTCSDNLTCSACTSINTEITSSYCSCKAGYYESKPLDNHDACQICYEECSSCNQPLLCLTCLDPNSFASISIGCECKVGYWKNTLLPIGSQCVPCFEQCAECETSDICTVCKDANSEFVGTQCVCKDGYYQAAEMSNFNACIQCNSECNTCFGSEFFHCNSCDDFLMSYVCVGVCPVGFDERENQCVQKEIGKPAVWFKFKSIGNFIDSVYGLIAVPIGHKRSLLDNVPSGAYLRGVYFPGSSFLSITGMNTRPLFSPQFTIATWINPEIESSNIFYKDSDYSHVSIFTNNLYLTIQLKINTNLLEYKSSVRISKNRWNQVTAIINYSLNIQISMIINHNELNTFNYINQPFVDHYNEVCYLGFGDQLNYFEGFIYEFSIYIDQPAASKIFSTECDSCGLCPVDFKCIPNCPIFQYFDENSGACENCDAACEVGCVRAGNCILSLDPNCESCSDFGIGFCTKCTYNFELNDGICEQCNNNSFYDVAVAKCVKCPELCLTCESDSVCSSCKENSSITKNICECDLGYSGYSECNRVTFTGKLSILTNNTLRIDFSEPLSEDFTSENLEVFLSGTKKLFSLNMYTKKSVILTLLSDLPIPRDSELIIKFSEDIVSSQNSLLFPTIYTVVLFPSDSNYKKKQLEAEIAKAKKLAYNGASIGLGITAGCSILLWDPTSLFDFLNTAEILYSSYLIQIEFYPVLEEFLLGMRVQSDVPNALKYIVGSNKGVQLPLRYIKYGFDTNLSLLNVGNHYTLLIWTFFTCLIVRIVRCKFVEKTEKLWKKYKFGVFLRFWIQGNLEIFSAVGIGFKYTRLGNGLQITDFVIGIIFVV